MSDPTAITLPFATCDVFTEVAFGGNPLAIVEGADALSVAQMQTIAREFNLSETIFVQSPDDPAHTAKVRIFFPTAEIPFAGHPTIGCAIHLALKDAPDGDFDTQVTLEEQAGLVPVKVWRTEGRAMAEFRAPVIPHAVEGVTTPGTDLLAGALGITPETIGFGRHRPAVWQGGPRFLYIPVRTLDTLAQARPQEPRWSEVMEMAGVDSAYLYTPGDACDLRARMFSPTAGIPEDPATGSASAILAAQLMASGALTGTNQFTLHQGVEMGRPSEITLTVLSEGDRIETVLVRGSAVPISQGRIRIP
ncbi:PhzF family phenazine biosynthesis protein [Sagittula sp. S175]|uniref:PhzF family phenazine biosynthesis protein n=1 Tax=Sagittula sp. S175 TaxID=3415129 RepID=UPI003C79E296